MKGLGWVSRLKSGLSRSSQQIGEGIKGIFTGGKASAEDLEALEEVLIMADLGPATAARLVAGISHRRFDNGATAEKVSHALAEDIATLLMPVAKPLTINPAHHPHTVLVVGVNGSGKTTTIGKLAQQYKNNGHHVTLVAGDSFRAAAVEQLQIWGQRCQVPVTIGAPGADPAGLIFTAHEQATADGTELLLIDTAGRLHNKAHLMEELQKISRTLTKRDATAPHDTVLVLDAGIGQNAVRQVEIFRQAVNITGLIVTKLDGTAKGGILVNLAMAFGLPIHAIGVGESAEDLRPFTPQEFAWSLLGIEEGS